MSNDGSISLGISFGSNIPPASLIEASRRIERHGFHEIWVHEDYFFHGGLCAAAMVLQATQKIPVGIGVVSAMVRHPAVTAMEIATVAGVHPGRLRVGIGVGATHWMKQLGLYPKSQLQALREVITTIRRLLAGEALTQTGLFMLDNVQLTHPVEAVPLYAGVIGPKSLALSGEIADGTVVSMMAGPRYVTKAREITSDAAAKAGHGRGHDLPTLAFCFADRDGKAARAVARNAVAQMLALTGPDLLTSAYGIDDQLRDMLARGGPEIIETEMPESWIDWFVVAGEPEQCLERIRDLARAGSTSVVLSLSDPATLDSSIDLLGEQVLRRL